MHCRAARQLVVLFAVAGGVACGQPINLSTAIEVTDVLGGYYDAGVEPFDYRDGRGAVSVNRIKPSLTFRLRNTTAEAISSVQVMASFWKAGEDGEADSSLVPAISGGSSLGPGDKTEPITIRSNIAFNVEGPRASLFTDRRFVEITVKLFGKRGGSLYRLGEYKLDQVILPHAGRTASRP
jgi:hypothetical protein